MHSGPSVPARHSQPELSDSAMVSSGHARQKSAVAPEVEMNVSPVHSTHAVLPLAAAYVPGTHSAQAVPARPGMQRQSLSEPLAAAECVCAGQTLHCELSCVANVPGMHAWHVRAFVADMWPYEQFAHAVLAGSDVYEPARQCTQRASDDALVVVDREPSAQAVHVAFESAAATDE